MKKTTTKKKKKVARKGRQPAKGKRAPAFTPAEQRAARASRILVEPAEPVGWMALSESGGEPYHIHYSPDARVLVCTCADYIFRCEPLGQPCKHILAVKLHIADRYLENEYAPGARQSLRRVA